MWTTTQYNNAFVWDGLVIIKDPMDDTLQKRIGITSTLILSFGTLY
ncbi:unnamed protein product, partial [marine sediment metagenome]